MAKGTEKLASWKLRPSYSEVYIALRYDARHQVILDLSLRKIERENYIQIDGKVALLTIFANF